MFGYCRSQKYSSESGGVARTASQPGLECDLMQLLLRIAVKNISLERNYCMALNFNQPVVVGGLLRYGENATRSLLYHLCEGGKKNKERVSI